ALAKEENGGIYWSLETNTPFYGWGPAGGVEKTAVAGQAPLRSIFPEPGGHSGFIFLLRGKGCLRVWYFAQGTLQAPERPVEVFGHARNVSPASSRTATIVVNGHEVKSIELPEPRQLVSPITVDLSQFVESGINQIQLRRPAGSTPASMQAVATYYVPWSESR